jgi:hypothetical protein
MKWVREIKQKLQETEKQKREFDTKCRKEYVRLTPMVMALLKVIGSEWYGKSFFVNKYKIDTFALRGVFFWGIKRRGKGLDSLPQRLHIKLRIDEDNPYFAIDAVTTDGPTLSVNTSDTSEENLNKTIAELIGRL